MTLPRFVLIPESTSQHCCFKWTIEDRSKSTDIGEKRDGTRLLMHEAVCEGFDETYGANGPGGAEPWLSP